MQPSLTPWQRLLSATPPFFKRAQYFGLALTGLGTSLAQVQGVPQQLTTSLISAGGAIAIIAQFAVKLDQPQTINPNDN